MCRILLACVHECECIFVCMRASVHVCQLLRKRMNNHRIRLSELYLYQHFSSNGHTLDDLLIVPIEEIQVLEGECITLAAKRLQREEYWYKELKSIYPYGLNDNVRK